MKIISPRLNRGIDDRAGSTTYFRRWNAGCDLELSNGVRVRERPNRSKLRLVIVNAILREVVIGGTLAIGGNRGTARAIETRRLRTALRVTAAGTTTARAWIAVIERSGLRSTSEPNIIRTNDAGSEGR